MTSEMHNKIIRSGLRLLLSANPATVESLVGIPVSKEEIEWCINNPVFDRKELEDLLALANSALNTALASTKSN